MSYRIEKKNSVVEFQGREMKEIPENDLEWVLDNLHSFSDFDLTNLEVVKEGWGNGMNARSKLRHLRGGDMEPPTPDFRFTRK